MNWREYHESTKHTVESLRRSPHYLDWANMPDPFRHYEGVPVFDLPADPPTFLSRLLYHSAAISASKLVPSTGNRYALRVNPSSGNLHPTEFHFRTRGLVDWPDGQYHYRPSSHMAEQHARGAFPVTAPLVFLLTSIAWREEWKYRDRAYRYCLLDIGHAWQSLALAAEWMGCEATAIGEFSDDDLAKSWWLNDDEWPMLLVEVRGAAIPTREPDTPAPVWHGGQANQLSAVTIDYPLVEAIHNATKVNGTAPAFHVPTGSDNLRLASFARTRRSALDFVGGDRSISAAQLSALMHGIVADFMQLYLYVHRVDGLAQGVYRWAEGGKFERVRAGDQRVMAAALSLGQDLAGNACVSFSMIADLERAARIHGDRAYRYVHFEAGAIGQRLYLGAESQGLRGTGIGAFYDDEVHRYLDVGPDRQVLYHFAIGYPVPDPRLEA